MRVSSQIEDKLYIFNQIKCYLHTKFSWVFVSETLTESWRIDFGLNWTQIKWHTAVKTSQLNYMVILKISIVHNRFSMNLLIRSSTRYQILYTRFQDRQFWSVEVLKLKLCLQSLNSLKSHSSKNRQFINRSKVD